MPDAPPDIRFMSALRAYRKGDAAGAIEILESILGETPDHPDRLEVLGKILEEQGDVDRAIAITERLVELQPESIMAHANLSRFWMLKGDKEVAEEWQSKARVLGWKDEIARKGEATGATTAERPVDPDTLAKQEQAVVDRPDDVIARMALASSYRKLDMPVKAVGHLREALKRDQGLSMLYLELGKALEASNMAREALPVYEQGLPIAEKNGDLMPRNQMASRIADLKQAGVGGDDD